MGQTLAEAIGDQVIVKMSDDDWIIRDFRNNAIGTIRRNNDRTFVVNIKHHKRATFETILEAIESCCEYILGFTEQYPFASRPDERKRRRNRGPRVVTNAFYSNIPGAPVMSYKPFIQARGERWQP